LKIPCIARPDNPHLIGVGQFHFKSVLSVFTDRSLKLLTIGGLVEPFKVPSTSCGSTLAPAASCTITLTFTPANAANGTTRETLTIADSGVGGYQNVPGTTTMSCPRRIPMIHGYRHKGDRTFAEIGLESGIGGQKSTRTHRHAKGGSLPKRFWPKKT
jgi:hypothetical protein